MRTTNGKAAAARLIAAVAMAAGVWASGQWLPTMVAVSAAESYERCAVEVSRTYPCVDQDGATLALHVSELRAIDFVDCVTEDGPAPCVWDTATHGNGTAGVGVARYVVIRN